jgi:serine/threonine-protein kinase
MSEPISPGGGNETLADALAHLGTLTGGDLLSALRADQARRWRAGGGPRVESYLALFPALEGAPEDALALIHGEVLLRIAAGETPELAEYQRRFPRLAGRLAEQFALPLVDPDADTSPQRPSGGSAGLPEVPGYEVLGRLGRGGMSEVHKARDVRLGRTVAIKLLLAGEHASPAELSRFRTEAEALARLAHPNIVQIYDVGRLGACPFLVLEFVDGPTLARRCGGQAQPPAGAARLVEVLARAVHAAHTQDVVHRDLKPGNVLLTADGTPKVTDFGLAKIVGGADRLTRTGEVMGTPAYMAPEQARGRHADVGPLGDVYALGAILYELLTGRPPFQGATVLETLDRVVRDEPTPPRRLAGSVPRDLETVCLKCLRKEPGRRYPSAAHLADDLRRFQAGEPVAARRVGPAGVAWRWAGRRPVVAGLLAALAAVVAVGVGLVSWQGLEAGRQRRMAEERLVQACDVIDSMLVEVGADELAGVPGAHRVRRRLLERSLRMYQLLRTQEADTPFLRGRAAHACRRTAEVLRQLDRPADALVMARRALELQQRVVDDGPAGGAARTELAACHNVLANIFRRQGDRDRAAEEFATAVRIEQAVVEADPDEPEYASRLATSRYNLGVVLREQKQLERAAGEQGEALAIRERLLKRFPDRRGDRLGLARGYYADANLLGDLGCNGPAVDFFGKAVAMLEELLKEDPDNPEAQHVLAQALHNRATRQQGDAARMALERAAGIHARLVEDHARAAEYRQDLILHLEALARRSAAGPKEEYLRRAIHHRRRLLEQRPDDRGNRVELGGSLNNLALLLGTTPRWGECRALYEEAVACQKAVLATDPTNARGQLYLGKHYRNLAGVLARANHPGEAADAVEAMTKLPRVGVEDLRNAGETLMRCRMLAHRYTRVTEAGREHAVRRCTLLARDVYRLARRRGANTSDVWCGLILLEADLGDAPACKQACREAVRRFLSSGGSAQAAHWVARCCAAAEGPGVDLGALTKRVEQQRGSRNTYAHCYASAVVLYRAGRFGDALARLEEAARLHGKGGAGPDRLLLALVHAALNQPAQARRRLDEGRAWAARADAGRLSDPLYPQGPDPWTWAELRLLDRQAGASLASRLQAGRLQ